MHSSSIFQRHGAGNHPATGRLAAQAMATVAALALCPDTAQAALMPTDSPAGWLAGVVAPTLVSFDGLADGTAVAGQYGGLGFSSFNGGVPLAAAESGPYSAPIVLSLDNPQLGGGGGVRIDFDNPQSAVAFWYSDSQFAGNTVSAYGAQNQWLGSYEFSYPHATEWRFIGFTSTTPDIVRIEVAVGSGDRVTLDNLQFSAAAVPEPGSGWLLLAGGLLVGVLRRRGSQA